MAMNYLPLALDWKTFNNRCPYCNSTKFKLLQSWNKTIEYQCKRCHKLFVTAPYPEKPDILYPVYKNESSNSGERVFKAPEYKIVERT